MPYVSYVDKLKRSFSKKLESCTRQFPHNEDSCPHHHTSEEYFFYRKEYEDINKGFDFYITNKLRNLNATRKPVITMGSYPHYNSCQVFQTKLQVLNSTARTPLCNCNSEYVDRPIHDKEEGDYQAFRQHLANSRNPVMRKSHKG